MMLDDLAHWEYRRALKWLYSFANYETAPADAYAASKFDLDRMRALLAYLDNPQTRFKTIHIAGTKGKGSTAAICESILRAANNRTGLFTSPHLHTFRERIRVAGEMVSPEKIAEGLARVRIFQPKLPGLTVFELMTALAFDLFARAGVQIAVVEVGLGGRLDATNVLKPRVAVLTSISYDHMAILGNTLTEIAREKAGIIKPNLPVVSAPQADEARAVIEKIARERNALLKWVDREWKFEPVGQNLDGQEFNVFGPNTTLLGLRIPLLGRHQLVNATTALAAIQILKTYGWPISTAARRQGIARVRWPGRFEILQRIPYLVVDGAHNRDSARQLVATIDSLWPKARVQWIFGASSDKDIPGMFEELLLRSTDLIITRTKHPRAADPLDLAKVARQYRVMADIAPTMAEALERGQKRGLDVVVVTGSLFAVAEARELFLRAQGTPVESDDGYEKPT